MNLHKPSGTMQSLQKPMEADEEERKQLSASETRYRDIAMTEYRRWGWHMQYAPTVQQVLVGGKRGRACKRNVYY